MKEEIIKKICVLAFDFKDESRLDEFYEFSVNKVTMYRDFNTRDLLTGVFLTRRDDKKRGVHINIFKNGDIFARDFPYYDGQLEVLAIWNQIKVHELIKTII